MMIVWAAVGLQVLTGAEVTGDGDSERAQLVMPRLRLAYDERLALVEVEAIRSISSGSLFGVAGDSQLIRLRRAELRFGETDRWMVRAGLVRIPWLEVSNVAWTSSDSQPHGWVEYELMDATDLGLSFEGCTANRLCGHITAVAGEGAHQRELNDSPSVHGATTFERHSLRLSLGAVYGMRGVSRARDHRAMALATWKAPRYSAFASWIEGWGRGDDGSVRWGLTEVGGSTSFGVYTVAARLRYTDLSRQLADRWQFVSSLQLERQVRGPLAARIWLDQRQRGAASERADLGQWRWRAGAGLSFRRQPS